MTRTFSGQLPGAYCLDVDKQVQLPANVDKTTFPLWFVFVCSFFSSVCVRVCEKDLTSGWSSD